MLQLKKQLKHLTINMKNVQPKSTRRQHQKKRWLKFTAAAAAAAATTLVKKTKTTITETTTTKFTTKTKTKTKTTTQTTTKTITTKTNTTSLQEIVSEYTAAYKIAGWGNTPILKIEPAKNGTLNVLVSGDSDGDIQRFNINTAEYARPKMLDTFDDETHIKHDKLAANTMFVQALAKVFKKTDHVLILDSLTGLTTAMMHSLFLGAGLGNGNPGQYLHVPNPAFAAAFEATPLCQQYSCTVFEWLRDQSHRHQTHFWLDYCCTFEGCVTQTLPKTDIKMLLHKDLLPRHQGLLGLTFSHRGVVGGSAATVRAVIHWLNHDAGPAFGYKFALSNQMEYGKITLLLFETI